MHTESRPAIILETVAQHFPYHRINEISEMRLVLLIALLFPPLGAARAAGDHGPLRFVDLTGEFDRVWAETKDVPSDWRVEEFEARFNKILTGFYSAERVKDFITAERYREMVLRGLEDYPKNRDGIRRVSAQFTKLITPARREFEAYFGAMRGYPPVYLVVYYIGYLVAREAGRTHDLKQLAALTPAQVDPLFTRPSQK
jgi:hypothetical protein